MDILTNSTLLVYADDIIIMGNTWHGVATKTYNFIKATKPMGLDVNQHKTNYLVMYRRVRRLESGSRES